MCPIFALLGTAVTVKVLFKDADYSVAILSLDLPITDAMIW